MNKHHNNGQRDGSKNRYKPPHGGIFREAFGLWNKLEVQERRDYKEGYRNAKKQR